MGEKRAVQVSHELWRQMMTQGYTSAGVRCVQGLPEDAQEIGVFANGNFFVQHNYTMSYIDPVFVFESESWATDASEQVIQTPWGIVPLFIPVFRVSECRTCTWWKNNDDEALPDDGYCFELAKSRKVGFGCTQYELKETDD